MSVAMAGNDTALEEFRRGWLALGAHRLRWRIALAVSLVIHLATLGGLGMPEIEHVERSEGPPLLARIAPLAPPAPAEAKVPAPPAPSASRAARKPRPMVDSSAERPAALAAEPVVPPAPQMEIAETDSDGLAQSGEPVQAERPATESPAVSASEPPAEKAIAFPQRIELEFDVARNADHSPLGRVVHRFERDGAHYVIQSVTAATGIAALFATGRYVQESRGTVTAQGLRPDQFVVRRGRAEKRIESAAFDWTSSRATVSAGGVTKEWALQPGAQDQLSMLHQLSFLISQSPPLQFMVTNGRRFYSANVEIVGHETVATGLGPLLAVQLMSQSEGESRINVWLALDYGNLPVKVRVRDYRGDVLEQVLSAMRVE